MFWEYNMRNVNILYIVKERPVLSSERAPYITKPVTVGQNKKRKIYLMSQMGS
jgi:hypothetical protein